MLLNTLSTSGGRLVSKILTKGLLSGEHFTGSVIGTNARGISLFSTSNNNKKPAPNAEPHINDAKARPAEQGLRLDDDVNNVNHSHPSTETDTEKQLRVELNKAVSENAALLGKSRDFEVRH